MASGPSDGLTTHPHPSAHFVQTRACQHLRHPRLPSLPPIQYLLIGTKTRSGAFSQNAHRGPAHIQVAYPYDLVTPGGSVQLVLSGMRPHPSVLSTFPTHAG